MMRLLSKTLAFIVALVVYPAVRRWEYAMILEEIAEED